MQLTPNPALYDVAALLAACGLPGDDIEPQYLADFVLARDGATPVGVAGLQVLGSEGLLRSVAVDAAHRNSGLGAQLVTTIERRAVCRPRSSMAG